MATPRKLRCTVCELRDHGGRVYSLRLRSERPLPQFRPGQFLHLALDPYDPSGFWPESRVFSIASSPGRQDEVEIVYSVKGRFTSRMEKELRAGGEVWVKLPYGEFVVCAPAGAEVALVAGGTGVTAFTAFLQEYAACAVEDGSRVHLFYGARSPRLLLFRESLARLAQARPAFRPRFFAEEGALDSPGVEAGRLSLDPVWAALRAPAAAAYYLSGPPVMIRAFSEELAGRGVAPGSIRVDAWE